ncbi:hypothetical protein Q4489_06760 [Thalassotalea sp. 1_MG-2023]|uniref:hypothetical protein n=1 Tax=Thalassotalea sp. 1_MG-2023 TaxID=3062680 RepID=UPI0026E333F7|nr:hypothetical protein [Thalassotalea sp. 1_MG-2023]MDO6426707.1 hypothetical protein [Thalassotalea sp. 1_MG-2023]
MNLDNVKTAWQQQNNDTGVAITINQTKLSDIKLNKQMQQLNNMKWMRIVESLAFFLIIVLLWQYIVTDFSLSAPTISAFVLNVFAIVGLAGNIGQIVLISQVDYSKPVSDLQKDIYSVCTHKLQLTKLLLMSVPFYMAYVFIGFDLLLGVDLFQHLEQHMIWFYSLSSTLLFFVTAYLLAKLDYKNISLTWVKNTIQFIVGERLVNMAQFINSIEST